MKTYYLKAVSGQALNEALEAAGIVQTWEGAISPIQGVLLDVIGVINQPTGVMSEPDAEGFTHQIMVVLGGYHANLLAELTPEQEAVLPIVIKPNNPVRGWA